MTRPWSWRNRLYAAVLGVVGGLWLGNWAAYIAWAVNAPDPLVVGAIATVAWGAWLYALAARWRPFDR